MERINGALSALITPFDREGYIDYEAYRQLINNQLSNDINGLVVNGTTAESPTLTHEEKLELVKIAMLEVGDANKIIVGVSSNNTQEIIDHALELQELGIKTIMVVTPFYNKTTQKGLLAMYDAILNATTLDILLYDVPSRTNMTFELATLQALARKPRIIGVKDATGDLDKLKQIVNTCLSDDFVVYCGNDDQIVEAMCFGACGVISAAANVSPKLIANLTNYMLDGDVSKAVELGLSSLDYIQSLYSEVNPVVIKGLASQIGVCANSVRLPLVCADEQNIHHALKLWKKEY